MTAPAQLRRELFGEALELPPPERAAFLDRACGDPLLRAEILALLAIDPPEHFLTPPDLVADPLVRPRFGPYRAVEAHEAPAELGPGRRLARHATTERLVAIELLPLGAAVDDHRIGAFARAAHAINRLRHPSSVPVHEHGRHAAAFWFARDHVEGHDLGAELERQRRPEASGENSAILPPMGSRECALALLAVFESVADLLRAAHRIGIAHGDVTATRILLDRSGRAFLTGFGIGPLLGRPTTAMADVAALSGLVHQALLDTHGRRGAKPSAAVTAAENANLAELERRTDPRRRRPYADAAALLADLRQVGGGQPLAARGWWETVARWFARCGAPFEGSP